MDPKLADRYLLELAGALQNASETIRGCARDLDPTTKRELVNRLYAVAERNEALVLEVGAARLAAGDANPAADDVLLG